MTIYVSGRQSGKTTFLIRQSADTGAVIVAPTCQMARYIDSMARDLGLQIPPHKSEYLAAQTAVDEVSVRRPSKDDESIRSIRLHDIPWIEPVELKCTYFRQDTGAIR